MENRKRELPKWILNVDQQDTVKHSCRKNEKLKNHGRQRPHTKKQKVSIPKIKDIESSSLLNVNNNLKIKPENVNNYHSISEDSDSEGSIQDFKLKDKEKSDPFKLVGNNRTDTAKTPPINSDDDEGHIQRESCIYGEKCYRKDLSHKKSYAHLGDSDYASPKKEFEKPECEYGLKCHRKNLKHNLDFKHSRRPQPKRYAKVKGKINQQTSQYSDSEEDSEDPFLVEFSSDEYVPSDHD